MTIPTTTDFDQLREDIGNVLFEIMLAGRASSKTECTGLRWVVEQDKDPYWMISIFGLGLDSPMALDTIAVYLGERDYDVENIEIILEADDDAI